jgi:hypothetical protein
VSEIYGSGGYGDRGGDYGNDDDYARFPDTRSPADLDPHYYDGDMKEALANDTSPNRFDYDEDPDLENYARGLTPETAWRMQGQPDSPDSWARYDQGEQGDASGTCDPRDLWGDTDPDAANYADLDDGSTMDLASTLTSAPDLPDSTGEDRVSPSEHQYPDAASERTDHNDSASTETAETDPASERIAQLESANQRLQSENADLGRAVAELRSENAQLGKSVEALEARLERLEQNQDDNLAVKAADDRTRGGLAEDSARAKQEQGKKAPSDEAVIFGAAAIGGALTTAADFVTYVPADIAGIGASFLAAGAAGVAWMHKRREGRHADRSED